MSLLIVDRIETDPGHPDRVSAEIRLGGRPERVVIDLSIPTFISFVQMPDALERHLPARNAVLDLMTRKHHDDGAPLPVDLSDAVRQANEPWPLRAPRVDKTAASEGATAAVRLEVVRTEHDQPEPGLVTVHVQLGGTPTVVVVDLRQGPQRAARFRFAEGAHPWQMTPTEQHALLVVLLAEAQRR